VFEYFEEFSKIHRDFDNYSIASEGRRMKEAGYTEAPGQGLFRTPSGSYTATTYTFNDPEHTMFVVLPVFPDGFDLFKFSGVGRNITWRRGNDEPRSLDRFPPQLRDPVYGRKRW
jgi:hypothetical protein